MMFTPAINLRTMRIKLLVLFHLICLHLQAQSIEDSQTVIVKVFDAISNRDQEKLKSLCTEDLIVIEDAALWNIDSLTTFMKKPVPADYKRVNTFRIISNITGDSISCISYENTAQISGKGNRYEIVWMESAVLILQNGKWHLKNLHSTTKKRRKL